MPLDLPILTPQEFSAALARLEERVTALEVAAGVEAARIADLTEKENVRSDELAKVAWAVKHGRKRPW